MSHPFWRVAGAPADAPSPRRPQPISASLLALLCLGLAACGGPVDEAHDDHDGEAHAEAGHEDHDEHDGEGEGHEEHADLVVMSAEDIASAGIVVERAARGPMPGGLNLPAEIRFDPDRVANLSVPVQGTVQTIMATEGDHVRAGQALAVISSRELADLKAEFLSAQADEELARSEAVRAEDLFAAEAVSEAELLTARANRDRAAAARAAAETKLHALGLEHDVLDRLRQADDGAHSQFRLTTPIDGRVVQRTLTLGESIEPAEGVGAPVFVIADTSVVWATVSVFDSDLGRVSEGDPIMLTDDAGRALARGTVDFVSPVIDPDSRTGTARAAVDNPDGALRPGQFVTARIETGAGGEALRVPADAVQTVENRAAVFAPEGEGFAPRSVVAGREAGGFVEILSGLSAGDAYVAQGAFTLKAELEKSSFGDGHVH